jgi:hypothetical protein
VITWTTAIDASSRVNQEFNKYACLLTWNGNAPVSGARYKELAERARHCAFFSSYDTYNSLSWIRVGDEINQNGYLLRRVTDDERIKDLIGKVAIGALITATVSLVVFGIFRGIGWIVAGFARD